MLINGQALKEWLGHRQTKKVIHFLNARKIPYWIVKGEPITTIEAINKELLVAREREEIEF